MLRGNVLRGMRYLFQRRMEKCSRLRGNQLPNTPGMPSGNVLRGMGYLFRRGMQNCSRLRRNQRPNTPGMLSGNVLRGKTAPNTPGTPCLKEKQRTKKAPALLQVLVIQLSGPNWA